MSLVVPILAALLSSDDSDPLIFAVIGAGLGVLLFVKGFRALQRKRLIMDTPTAKVRSAAIGLVELQGTAVGPFTITAPLTQAPCYYHQTLLWKWVQRGKNSEWEKIADERMHVPFYLKDSTGMVLVDPNGAEMELHCDYKREFKHSLFGSSPVEAAALNFMNRYGCSTSNTVKLEEYCIRPEHALFILGTLATNPGLRPIPNGMPTLAGNFKLGHWTLNMKGTAGSELAAQLLGSSLAGLSFSSTPGTQTRVTTSSFGPIQTKTTVTTTAVSRPETLQPGDPRAGAVVAAVAARDPELAAKIAAQLHVPYPPTGAIPPASNVTVTQEPGGKTQITSVQVLSGSAAVNTSASSLMPAEAHQLAVAALAAKNPELAAAVATVLGRTQAAAAIRQAAGGDAPAAAPGSNGGMAWPDHDPTLIMKGTHNPAYFISWQSQKDVIKELSQRSLLYIFGGPVLTVVCMLYILSRFDML